MISDIFVVPTSGNYYRCLHYYEWRGKPRAARKPMPETVPMLDKAQFVPLNKAWQEFWFGLLVKAADGTMTYAQLLDAWASLTCDKRAFTDQHSVQNGFCDFILKENMGAKPISIKTLSCGGNIVQIKSKGIRISFRTLDIRNAPPKIDDVWNDQAVIHWATECVRVPEKGYPNKSYMVDKFPQLKGRGVPFPIVSMKGINSTWMFRLKQINNGQEYSPYNLPKNLDE